jgi:hypothetical protein
MQATMSCSRSIAATPPLQPSSGSFRSNSPPEAPPKGLYSLARGDGLEASRGQPAAHGRRLRRCHSRVGIVPRWTRVQFG